MDPTLFFSVSEWPYEDRPSPRLTSDLRRSQAVSDDNEEVVLHMHTFGFFERCPILCFLLMKAVAYVAQRLAHCFPLSQ